MKNLNKKLSYAIYIVLVAFLMVGCGENTEGKAGSKYTSMELLLNDCVGHAIVVTTAFDDSYLGGYEYFIIVKDKNNKTYTYQGSNFDVAKGDTLMVK